MALKNVYKNTMEMQLDMNGLDKECACGSGKLAGCCCRKDEACPCGSGLKVCECCVKEKASTPAEEDADATV